MRYVYQRNGAPLLSWRRAPPQETRGADAKALGGYEDYPGGQLLNVDGVKAAQAMGCGCSPGLGSLAGSSLDGPTVEMPLPRAGAPEPLPSIGGITDTISGLSTPVKIAGAVGLYLLYKKLSKRR